MKREYKISSHNSTVCGYPGRQFDWNKFDWEGKAIHKSIFKGQIEHFGLLRVQIIAPRSMIA